MFYDQAERCYARAEELDPESGARPTIARWPKASAAAAACRPPPCAASSQRRRSSVPRGGGSARRSSSRGTTSAPKRHGAAPRPPPEPPRDAGQRLARTRRRAAVAAYAALGLARLALVRERLEQAREMLEGVTTRAPRFGPAFRLLGDIYARLDRSADAERAVQPRQPPAGIRAVCGSAGRSAGAGIAQQHVSAAAGRREAISTRRGTST